MNPTFFFSPRFSVMMFLNSPAIEKNKNYYIFRAPTKVFTSGAKNISLIYHQTEILVPEFFKTIKS
jgi:hypothetical protein